MPVPGSEYEIEIDQLIPAIGQRPDISALEDLADIRISRWDTTEVNPLTLETDRPGVFAGGDLQTGPWVAIGAVAAGREAAESIVAGERNPDVDTARGDEFGDLARRLTVMASALEAHEAELAEEYGWQIGDIIPIQADIWPKPTSSRIKKITLGVPSLARTGCGQAGSDSDTVRPITPGNAVPGLYSFIGIL